MREPKNQMCNKNYTPREGKIICLKVKAKNGYFLAHHVHHTPHRCSLQWETATPY